MMESWCASKERKRMFFLNWIATQWGPAVSWNELGKWFTGCSCLLEVESGVAQRPKSPL